MENSKATIAIAYFMVPAPANGVFIFHTLRVTTCSFLLVALKSKVISADGKYKWYLGATELFL